MVLDTEDTGGSMASMRESSRRAAGDSTQAPSMPPRHPRTRAGLAALSVLLVLLLCACGTLATCTAIPWDDSPPEDRGTVPVTSAGYGS